MPVDAERHARLYFDPSCGPCRFFAESVAGVSRGRVTPVPYDAPASSAELGDLPDPVRYASAHVVRDGARASGAAIVRPLLGSTLGPRAALLMDRAPVLERSLEWVYRRFWEHRQRHGCAAAASPRLS